MMANENKGISQNELNNNVSAVGQLGERPSVRFEGKMGGMRVLIIGNSITWHAPNEGIGWPGDWGMAASAPEKDFVHRLCAMLSETYGDVSLCIAQLASWERGYEEGRALLDRMYDTARDFAADLVVVRIGENMPRGSAPACKPYFDDMIKYFCTNPNVRVVISDDFWHNDARDEMIREIAEENGYVFCQISDLEQDPRTMALGEYEHRGVSLHPSDYGMEQIACRLFETVKKNFEF